MRRLTATANSLFRQARYPGRPPSRTAMYSVAAALVALGGGAVLSTSVLVGYLDERTDREIEMSRDLPLPEPPRAGHLPMGMAREGLVLLLDRRGRVTQRYLGHSGLPAFPRLTVARLNAYAARPHPVTVGSAGEYRALVVRDTDRSGYRVIAHSTAETDQAVGRLLRYEAALAVPLLGAVFAGAHRLNRREARNREARERRQQEFVAAAGHELRNQLTTIAGYAELARTDGEEEPHRRMRENALWRVGVEAKRMTSLIDELDVLSRLGLGQPLQWQRVELSRLCRDAVSAARDCHPEHPVRLLIAPGKHTVHGDPRRLHQIVANLLINARVHTPEGTTTTLGLGTEDGYRVIEVMDDGPGVPPELRDRIFDHFVRGEDTTAVGSGLGLSIIAAVAAAHGGTVRLEPSERGAWFRVRLPATSRRRPADAATGGGDKRCTRLLP